jgi:DNA invertase Pin-like site-specific DNA recombinase
LTVDIEKTIKDRQQKRLRKDRKTKDIFRVAFYRRVSTREQVDEGQSLQAQRGKIENYIKLDPVFQDKEIIEEDFVDEGRSAKDLKREALSKLIKSVRNNEIDFVIVVKLDRLTRRLVDLQHLTDLFAKHHVTLLSINEKLDTQSATGRFFISILGSLAQLEREQVSERVQDVFEQLVHDQPLGGKAPFGYFYVSQGNLKYYLPYLSEYAKEHNILPIRVKNYDEDIYPGVYANLMFDWYLSNPSCKAIATRLTELGIPTPTQVHEALKGLKEKSENDQQLTPYLMIDKPKNWGGTTVRKILTNPFYAGLRVWKRYENRLKRIRPPEEWIFKHNTHPSLISPDKFQLVDDVFEEVGRRR